MKTSFLLKVVVASVLFIIVIVGIIYASNQFGGNSLSGSQQTATPTPTAPADPTDQPSITPPSNSPQTTLSTTPAPTVAPSTGSSTVTFDFDTGSPTVNAGKTTPFDQTKDLVTATFSSPTTAGFSVQNYEKTFYKLSQFQGNYLFDNNPSRDILEIKFSKSLSSIAFTFATFESDGGPTDQPSMITLTAYMGSTQVGSTVARGTWPEGDSYPQGTLTYNSGGQAFNSVKIEVLYQGPTKAVDYMVDTITVKTI